MAEKPISAQDLKEAQQQTNASINMIEKRANLDNMSGLLLGYMGGTLILITLASAMLYRFSKKSPLTSFHNNYILHPEITKELKSLPKHLQQKAYTSLLAADGLYRSNPIKGASNAKNFIRGFLDKNANAYFQFSTEDVKVMQKFYRSVHKKYLAAGLLLLGLSDLWANPQEDLEMASRILENPALFSEATEHDLEEIAKHKISAQTCLTIHKILAETAALPDGEFKQFLAAVPPSEKENRRLFQKNIQRQLGAALKK